MTKIDDNLQEKIKSKIKSMFIDSMLRIEVIDIGKRKFFGQKTNNRYVKIKISVVDSDTKDVMLDLGEFLVAPGDSIDVSNLFNLDKAFNLYFN